MGLSTPRVAKKKSDGLVSSFSDEVWHVRGIRGKPHVCTIPYGKRQLHWEVHEWGPNPTWISGVWEAFAQRNSQQTLAHKPLYTQLSHRGAFTQSSFYTQKLLLFTQKGFYTKRFYAPKLLHAEAFRQSNFYTQPPICPEASTHKSFYTQTLLHTEAFTQSRANTEKLLQTKVFTHSIYTQKLLHRGALPQRSFYTQKLLHTDAFTHRSFYTQKLLLRESFTQSSPYTQQLLHTEAFTPSRFYAEKFFTQRSLYTHVALATIRRNRPHNLANSKAHKPL